VLKIVVADLKRFSDFMSEHLMKAPEVANIRSSVVLESIKETGAYPVRARSLR
jgi:DNA-binding Lrp family transcriptional regulator